MNNKRTLFVRIVCLLLVGILCLGLVAVAASADGVKVNRMRRFENLSKLVYDEAIHSTFWDQGTVRREWVNAIRFQDTLDGMPKQVLDFSEHCDKSVVGWYKDNTLTVAADGKIALPKNSSWLFAYFINLEELDFGGAVTTEGVTSMEAMFFCCRKLKALDVSFFDTSKVTNMSRMFGHCETLETLDVAGFDTAAVKDFSYMFFSDAKLQTLDVKNFNTSASSYFHSMFYRCRSLTALDVTGFDTSNAITIAFMFSECPNLKDVDTSGFDTSKVTTQFILP